jgi:hypothetical protein
MAQSVLLVTAGGAADEEHAVEIESLISGGAGQVPQLAAPRQESKRG